MPLKCVVIEHLEPVLSTWLFLEYKHSAELADQVPLVITNVRDHRERELLSEFVEAREESVAELSIPRERMIVLDPQAPRELTPSDFDEDVYVVVGGIMGDYPPRGRTAELLTARLRGALVRNIGEGQFPIDCAVYVALKVSEGLSLDEIPVVEGLEIRTSEYHSIVLPYSYPLKGGRPLISDEVLEYLLFGIEGDEASAVAVGRVLSVTERDLGRENGKLP